MQDGPLQRYRQMVLVRELAPDTAQELAAEKLQLLANRLAQYSEPRLGHLLPFARRRRTAPEGLYLYGGVGRGKTMLLDLFFDAVHYAPKRRVHFQEFMAEAHEAIERGRKAAADPIASAAAEMANDAALLCFDELEVTDIADAMILGRAKMAPGSFAKFAVNTHLCLSAHAKRRWRRLRRTSSRHWPLTLRRATVAAAWTRYAWPALRPPKPTQYTMAPRFQ